MTEADAEDRNIPVPGQTLLLVMQASMTPISEWCAGLRWGYRLHLAHDGSRLANAGAVRIKESGAPRRTSLVAEAVRERNFGLGIHQKSC